MLGWRKGVKIAQLAAKCRICCSYSRQLLVKPALTCRSVRCSGSTVVADNSRAPTDAAERCLSPVPWRTVVCASDAVAEKHVSESLRVYRDFISQDEEKCLFDEVEPYLRRLKYEHDHWDDVSDFISIIC